MNTNSAAPHPAPAAPSDGKALQRLIEVAVSHAADMTRAAHVVAAHPFNMAATAREFDLAAAELLAAVKAVQAESGLVGVTMDKGPWIPQKWSDGRVVLQSDDFTHDVALIVNGDFASPTEKMAYAEGVARQLNAVRQSKGEPT